MADPSTHEVKTIELDDVPAILDRAEAEAWTALSLIAGEKSFAARPGPYVYVIKDGRLSDTLVARLSGLTALTSLNLAHNGIGSAGAQSLSGLTALTSLDLTGNDIGAAGARSLSGLTALTSLNLTGNSIGDAGAQSLSGLTALTSLDLAYNGIGAAGARSLSGLTALTSLNLMNNDIGAAGAQSLSGLTGLTSLDLSDNGIGDAGAHSLSGLTALTSLDLSGNGIGAAGARSLSGLTALTSLYLWRNGIGDAGARALLDAWVDAPMASDKRFLVLRDNAPIGDSLPSELFDTADAQEILAVYRRFRDGLDPDEDPDPLEKISADQPRAPVFAEADGRLDLNSRAGADEVSNTPLTRDLHAEALRLAKALAVAGAGNNRYPGLDTLGEMLVEALGQDLADIRPGLLIPRAAALSERKASDDRMQVAADPDEPPLPPSLRQPLANAWSAIGPLVGTDDHLAGIDAKRLTTADPPFDPAPGRDFVTAASEADALTRFAQDIMRENEAAAPDSELNRDTTGNLLRAAIRHLDRVRRTMGPVASKIADFTLAHEELVLATLRFVLPEAGMNWSRAFLKSVRKHRDAQSKDPGESPDDPPGDPPA